MEENNQTISEFEIKLAQFNELPNDVELLKDVSLLYKMSTLFVMGLVGYNKLEVMRIIVWPLNDMNSYP